MRLLKPLLLILLLAGCAGLPPPPGCTSFGRHGAVCLLPPDQLPALDGSRLVTVTHDGKQDSFLGLLHIDAGVLRLDGSTLFGTGLFDLSYDGKVLQMAPPQATLHPDLLVVMLELSLVDPALLRAQLYGLTLNTRDEGGQEIREIFEDGRLIAHIERDDVPLDKAHIRIDIPPAKLSVDMRPMDQTAAP